MIFLEKYAIFLAIVFGIFWKKMGFRSLNLTNFMESLAQLLISKK
jgi:hypothetical protein